MKALTGRATRSKGCAWQSNEDQVLRNCIQSGLSLDDIAAHCGILPHRSKRELRNRLIHLGHLPKPEKIPWDDWEIELVDQLGRKGLRGTQIKKQEATLKRRSPSAIAVRLSKLKLTVPQNPRWEEAEDAELFRLVGEKVKLKEIPSRSAILSSRSPSAVKNRWSCIGKHKKAGKKWTHEEDSVLREIAAKGKGPKRIARLNLLPGRTAFAINTRMRELKLKTRVRPAEWSPTEDETCIQLFKAGKTFQQIADDPQIIGRSESGVRTRLIHLKQILPDSSRFWSDDEDKVIAACISRSESLSSIARAGTLPNRTLGAIIKRARDLGYKHPKRRDKWSANEIVRLAELTQQGWKPLAISESGQIPGRSYDSINQVLRRQRRAAEKMADESSSKR